MLGNHWISQPIFESTLKLRMISHKLDVTCKVSKYWYPISNVGYAFEKKLY